MKKKNGNFFSRGNICNFWWRPSRSKRSCLFFILPCHFQNFSKGGRFFFSVMSNLEFFDRGLRRFASHLLLLLILLSRHSFLFSSSPPSEGRCDVYVVVACSFLFLFGHACHFGKFPLFIDVVVFVSCFWCRLFFCTVRLRCYCESQRMRNCFVFCYCCPWRRCH